METSAVNIHAELIEKCKHCDQTAQYEVYRLYSKAMFNTAMRITGNREDAEDVLQESFVNAFRKITSYRGEASFGAWLKQIVVNKAITQLKKGQQAMMISEDIGDDHAYEPFNEDTPFSVETIKAAVAQLPAGFRSVLTLYLFEGYDHGEIGEILGISESTSKTQFKRAKERVQSILRKEVKYG